MGNELQQLPRSRLPIWPALRFIYRRAPSIGRLVGRAAQRLPERSRDVMVAELGTGLLAAWREHDVATLLAFYDADAVIDMSGWADWPDRPVYRGAEGVRQFFDDWDSAWADFRMRPTRQIGIDAERYLLEIQFEGRGVSSGIEVRQRFFQIAEARDGQMTRMANYTDEAEARAAAWLSLHRTSS
jgi:ketosteroid isomerase-like protein